MLSDGKENDSPAEDPSTDPTDSTGEQDSFVPDQDLHSDLKKEARSQGVKPDPDLMSELRESKKEVQPDKDLKSKIQLEDPPEKGKSSTK